MRRAVDWICYLGVGVILVAGMRDSADLLSLAQVSLLQWTGYGSLAYLVASQLLHPLARFEVVDAGMQVYARRKLGVTAAALATLHFLICVTGYLRLNLVSEADDSPWLQSGLAAWIILMALWLTSYPSFTKKLRLRLWKPLHRLTYLALLLSLIHLFLSPWATHRWSAVVYFGVLALWTVRLACGIWPPGKKDPATSGSPG